MNTGVRLGQIRGVDVVVDVSVFAVAVLLAWVNHIGLDSAFDLGSIGTVLAVVVAVVYVASLLLHETLHAVVAARRGLRARRIRLLVFGGYSLIDGSDESPADEFWVAMAGPIGSLVAGGGLWALSAAMQWHEPTADTLLLLAVVNMLIAGLNLLPGLPLDGGRALRALLWNINEDRLRSTRLATQAGMVLGAGVAAVGVYLLLTSGVVPGVIWMLLGWFLYRSATSAGKREELIVLAAGSTARDVMHPTPEAVPGALRVADVTALFQSGPTMRALPVDVDGRVKGIIGQAEIDVLAPGRRELGRAASVMTRIGPGDIVDANTPVEALLTRPGEPRWVVVDEGVAVGMIEAADLEQLLA